LDQKRKASIAAIIAEKSGTFTVLQVFDEETVDKVRRWKDKRGEQRSITLTSGVHPIKRRFSQVPTYGRALAIHDAIISKDKKFLNAIR
jgi:hypothetical protein